MKKKWTALVLAAGLLGLLSGCFRSVDELYALPKLPEEYQNLQSKIEEVTTGTGAEYSAPQSGVFNQPVQLQDLDGDGVMEAIAFFKVTNDEKPLKIYIFRLTGEGYEVAAIIETEGSYISSIDYEDLSGGPAKELVVNGNAYFLSVYSIEDYEVTELMRTSYTSFQLQDLDMDNRKEIALVRTNAVEGKSWVEYWDSDGGGLVLRSSPLMSEGVTGTVLDGVQSGFLRGTGDTLVPALFVTSYQGDGILTDIFACREGKLENITLEGTGQEGAEVGVSYGTRRVKDNASLTDINDDSYMEIPIPVPGATVDSETLYAWFQYDLEGKAIPVFTTYHNYDYDDNWYFILPEGWEGKVSVSQYSTSGTGERATIFTMDNGDGAEPQAFLTIYRLTGANRHMRSRMGERFTLASDETTIYSAELKTGGWDCGLDEEGVKALFHLSRTDWSSGS